jgi:uncharacterized membrane protein SpoIIM required for sporulation
MKGFRPEKRVFVFVSAVYLAGTAFGMFLMRKQEVPQAAGGNFLGVFCTNYWHVFLIWILGFSLAGLLFSTILVFFRGFLFGALLSILFPGDLNRLFFLLLMEIALFLPAFFLVSSHSLELSLKALFSLFSHQNYDLKTYLNIMLIATAFIAVYSIIIMQRV